MAESFFNCLHLLHETQKSLAESLYQLSLKETMLTVKTVVFSKLTNLKA